MGARSVLASASAEKVGEQRNQRNVDQGHTAARHELFNTLTFWTVSVREQLFMAGGGVALIGITLVPLLSNLFG